MCPLDPHGLIQIKNHESAKQEHANPIKCCHGSLNRNTDHSSKQDDEGSHNKHTERTQEKNPPRMVTIPSVTQRILNTLAVVYSATTGPVTSPNGMVTIIYPTSETKGFLLPCAINTPAIETTRTPMIPQTSTCQSLAMYVAVALAKIPTTVQKQTKNAKRFLDMAWSSPTRFQTSDAIFMLSPVEKNLAKHLVQPNKQTTKKQNCQ